MTLISKLPSLRRAWLAAVISASACSPSAETSESAESTDSDSASGGSTTNASTADDSTDTSTTERPEGPEDDSSSSSESGDPVPEVCACAETAVSACGGSRCGHVSADCDYECPGEDEYEINDLDALECVLAALRDRTPGVLTWRWSENGGQYEESLTLALLDDGTALVGGSGSYDLEECPKLATRHIELRPAAYFDDCLSEDDPGEQFHCLRSYAQSTLVICDEDDCFEGV